MGAKSRGAGNAAVQFIRNLKRDRKGKKAKAEPKLSRNRQPEDMPLDIWQRELRKQYGRDQKFQLRNLGDEPVFSEFAVTNPQSKNTYRVTVRGSRPGDNHCTCADFQTNLLGTCKHIEFAIARIEKKPGGKKALQDGFQPPYSDIYLQYGAQREVRFRPGSECPKAFAHFASEFFGADGSLGEDGYARFEDLLAKAGESEHDLRCGDDALNFVAERRDAQRRKEKLKEMFPKGIHSAAFKSVLKVPLYDYQRQGALFAAQAGRSLIGDEMGLGKTVQAIAAAEIMSQAFGVEKVLIVCPTSLKHQWEREIAKFCDRSARVIAGFRAEREKDYAIESFFKIVNYDTIHRDLDLISAWGPDLVILDEAQRIKNWETRVAKSVKKIQSPYALVLTGTPLENRLEELVSIVQFIDKHRLGPTYQFLNDHQHRDDHGRVIGYKELDRISRTLEPVLLRRRKAEVLEQLPPRIDKTLFFAMTELQQKHHAENKDAVAQIVQKWRRYGFLSEADRVRLMICLQNMRMSCDNSFLLDKESDCGPKADEFITLMGEVFEDPEAKVVVFSQWTAMHELLIRRLEKANVGYAFFHGGVESKKRRDLIDRFRDDPKCRVFLSTDAGGVGLNLQFASNVVNMDLPWNPAVLEQRIGRVYRLGQTRPVQVFNFVSQGTIEEGMLEVLKFKKSMFAGVLDGGDKQVFLGGTRLKKFMESVDDVTGRITPSAEVASAEVERVEDVPAPVQSPRRPNRPIGNSTPSATYANSGATSSNGNGTKLPPADPIAALLQTGMSLLSQLASGQESSNGKSNEPAAPVRRCVDESTGEEYLRLSAPSPEVVNQLVSAVSNFLTSLRG